MIHRIFAGAFALIAASITVAAPLPRATPESQGISSAAVLDVVNALDRDIEGVHSVMILRHGHVIAEGWWAPYTSEFNHVLYSLSKSFTSTAVGFAVAEGKLSIDDEVLKFFPDDAPENPSNNLKAMRVRDLLTMTTGHQDEPPTSPDQMSAKSFLAQEVPHLPGTHFKYNTAATFMQSAIVQQVTGETVLEYLRSRLFEPLGIAQPVWDSNFEGINLGGYGLRVRTEEIAKFGQLYLQRGNWNGRQLLPADWIDLATSRQVSNGSNPRSDWNQGYGFQFWRSRHNAYRGDGAFGQFCIVMPDQDMVVAITSGLRDMQAVMNIVWDKLIPAAEGKRLRRNRDAHEQLQQHLASLKLPTVEGAAAPDAAAKHLNKKFSFTANEQGFEHVTIRPADGNSVTIDLRIGDRDVSYDCAHGDWRKGSGFLPGGRPGQALEEPFAACFAWANGDTLLARVTAYETPFQLRLRFTFSGEELTLESESNVAFGPTKRPNLTARTE
ncbi:MAG TPA: serine hydrolase [Verrucomicrobiales bacterium]|nr:serine hydrolase [Verrucomicrobiales bacterium]